MDCLIGAHARRGNDAKGGARSILIRTFLGAACQLGADCGSPAHQLGSDGFGYAGTKKPASRFANLAFRQCDSSAMALKSAAIAPLTVRS